MSEKGQVTQEYLKSQIKNLETQITNHKQNEMKLFVKLEEKYSNTSKQSVQDDQSIPSEYGYVKLSNAKKMHNNAKIFGTG